MATIITKNSSTASSVPLAAQLVQGELAVNVTDKRLFTENSGGTVVELGTNPSSLTNAGNLDFTGTGNRITGDFTNGTVANRVMFQTSTANGNTILSVLPTGTSSGTFSEYYQNGTDPANSALLSIGLAGGAGVARINSTITGTGTYLPMAMWTGGSERVRVDTSGNVGIGTSTAVGRLTSEFNTTGTVTNTLTLNNNAAGAGNGVAINFYASNTSQPFTGRINSLDDGNFGYHTVFSNKVGGSSGAGALTERARIDSSGNLSVGRTSGGGRVNIQANTNNFMNEFFNQSGGSVGSIQTNGTTVSYNTSSDYRLKEAVKPMQNALARNALLNPVFYKWKVDGSEGEGFIADQLQGPFPSAVSGEKDAVDAEGNPVYQGIGTGPLDGHFAACVNELQDIITALTARITALETE